MIFENFETALFLLAQFQNFHMHSGNLFQITLPNMRLLVLINIYSPFICLKWLNTRHEIWNDCKLVFAVLFRRYLTRSIGFEAVLRLRCTKGRMENCFFVSLRYSAIQPYFHFQKALEKKPHVCAFQVRTSLLIHILVL